jgi:uncharacterized protein (TIGR02246 family)
VKNSRFPDGTFLFSSLSLPLADFINQNKYVLPRPRVHIFIDRKYEMKKLLFVISLLLSAAVIAKEPPKRYDHVAVAPTTAEEKEIAGLFDRWNAALATGKPEEVVKLYAPNGILQPTVSNKIRATPEEIKEYFEHFLLLKPKGTINYRQIRILGENLALDSGAYTFDVLKNGKPAKVRARYTYVYEKIDGDWKIINHHSSAMPEFTEED